MTSQSSSPLNLGARILWCVAVCVALYVLLLTDYPPQALAVATCIIALTYMAIRIVNFFDEDRFSPKRVRVGLLWAVAGVSTETDEFDTGPALFYVCLFLVLSAGLVLRPLVQWVLL